METGHAFAPTGKINPTTTNARQKTINFLNISTPPSSKILL
jgi:hypothetical protein